MIRQKMEILINTIIWNQSHFFQNSPQIQQLYPDAIQHPLFTSLPLLFFLPFFLGSIMTIAWATIMSDSDEILFDDIYELHEVIGKKDF